MWHGSCLGKKRESLMTLARRLVFCLAILALLPWWSIEAEALTITTPPTLLYSGNVFYPDVSFTGPGHIIGKTFNTLDSISATVSYDRYDFDLDPYGFRWSEHILNNTGVPWTGFHVEISAGDFLNVAAGLNSVPGPASIWTFISRCRTCPAASKRCTTASL